MPALLARHAGHDPVTAGPRGFGDHDNNNVLATAYVIIPSCEQAGAGETGATTNLVRVGKGFFDTPPMSRQQVGVIFGDVPLPLISQLHLPA